jgi:prepilin-type N-terminal cleavage/methylation domain-containing protein
MPRLPRPVRGFTLVELVVTLAVVLILGALAWSNLGRLRPRARLADASSELVALVHGARQHALATGRDVVVMVFPAYAGPESTGRVIVYEDGDQSLLSSTATPNFGNYDPNVLARGAQSDIVATYDLPRSIVLGPATGVGASAALPAPLASIRVNVDCSFCKTGGDRRGAIRFDPRGRAFFYSDNTGNGQPAVGVQGGSLSLSAPEVGGQRTLVVTSGTGSVSLRQQGG